MSHVRRFNHVGLTVADLDVVTAFFVALGLEVEGRTFVEGEFLDTVCGIPGSRTEIVMLKLPDDGTRLGLSSFVRPDSVPGSQAAMANELGLRNVAFEVNDLQAAVDWAATEGYGLVEQHRRASAPRPVRGYTESRYECSARRTTVNGTQQSQVTRVLLEQWNGSAGETGVPIVAACIMSSESGGARSTPSGLAR